ncbi:MAG TPA: helix-turn-helix transcriptional regulator [Candidatus Polarisedimenticolaceae bacterium]|nr:helix-turn-helix transcriptional regulator [Candidatus Polarisedimenticolaceae bacterium]
MNQELPRHATMPAPPGGADGRPSLRLGQHLRRLREGYGYTLRKVEEKALTLGEAIDNSQLSRFEKGKALPSFDKLRALARIFNVSVQNFSDVLDLEELSAFRPESDDVAELLAIGADLFARGEPGRAFVAFEKVVEIAEAAPEGPDRIERLAEARWRMAASLKALGKLGMCERELREVLKLGATVGPRIRTRALLHLAFVYRELGDLYLAQVLAREALDLAAGAEDGALQAAALNTLGNILEVSDLAQALSYYERAYALVRDAGESPELPVMVLTNLGGCLTKLQRATEGMARLQEAHAKAREHGLRRVAALSATRIAEALQAKGDLTRAGRAFAESDALAGNPDAPYHDILFLNSYHRWVAARDDGNGTREKIAFGRLRHLRASLERRFPEVDEFDRWVAKHGRYAHEHRS